MERRLANEEITLASLKCPPNLMKAGEVRKSGEGRNRTNHRPLQPVNGFENRGGHQARFTLR